MAKLGIMAGSGALPYKVAEAAAKKKTDVFVVAYAGAAEKDVKTFPHQEFSLLQINSIIKKLKEEECKQLVFIGKVERPAETTDNLIADIPAKLLDLAQTEMAKQNKSSDDIIMSLFVRYLEEVENFTIIGAEKIYTDLTMKAGFLTGKANEAHKADIDLAIDVALAMGDLDVGQAVVVSQGQVLAVEAAEGTDKMLERVLTLPEALRGNEKARAGVLVKLPRRHQDLRIDMPTIGKETLVKASKAGLAGIVFKENSILIDDKAGLKAAAEKEGLFIQAVKIK